MLKTLYNAPMSTSHHIYMSLIVFLILTEEQLFNYQVHAVVSFVLIGTSSQMIEDTSF